MFCQGLKQQVKVLLNSNAGYPVAENEIRKMSLQSSHVGLRLFVNKPSTYYVSDYDSFPYPVPIYIQFIYVIPLWQLQKVKFTHMPIQMKTTFPKHIFLFITKTKLSISWYMQRSPLHYDISFIYIHALYVDYKRRQYIGNKNNKELHHLRDILNTEPIYNH